jgi:hypothetical protein
MEKIKMKMRNKRGLSGVVETLVIILIVFVALGIIWFVLRGLIGKSVDSSSDNVKCIDNRIEISNAGCSGSVCNLSLYRSAGKEIVAGIRIVFSGESSSSNYIKLIPGDIPFLTTKRIPDIPTEISDIDKIEVAIIMTDDSGQNIDCPVTASQKLN